MKSVKISFHFSLICLLGIALFGGFLMEAFLFLIIVCLHEGGHIFFILMFGGKITTLHLSAIGGMIEIEEDDLSVIQKLLISIGGLLINVIILIVLNYVTFPNHAFIKQFNQLMLMFNLLPIYPLDGYRLIYHFLSLFYEDEFLTDVLFYLSLLGIVILSFFSYLTKSLGLGLIVAFLTWKSFELKQRGYYQNISRYYRFQKLMMKPRL